MTTNRITASLIALLFCLMLQAQSWKEHGRLQVSKENPHYLAFQDGKPFF